LLAVTRSSNPHAVTRIEMDLREGSPVLNQCREFGSGSRRLASAQSHRLDNPSKRQKVTTLAWPHASQTSFSSPSI
jgi:hypothetical protein